MLLLLVTLSSLLLAAIMTTIAWRLSSEERRRSDARVAALAADIHHDLRMRPPRDSRTSTMAPNGQAAAAAAHLFEPSAVDAGKRRVGFVMTGAAVAAVAIVAGVLASRAQPQGTAVPVSSRAGAAATRPAAARSGVPLELIALTHERDGDQLTVRGTVRNPTGAAELDKLTAVVFVFGKDGAFITSGRAAIASPALTAGGESTFVVTVPDAGDVARYRVSFRTDEAVVPHVDRRERPQEKG